MKIAIFYLIIVNVLMSFVFSTYIFVEIQLVSAPVSFNFFRILKVVLLLSQLLLFSVEYMILLQVLSFMNSFFFFYLEEMRNFLWI